MSVDTFTQGVRRIREHCERHAKHDVSIILHGGEPLLGGPDYLDTLALIVDREFQKAGIHAKVGIQSNGLLFDDDIGQVLLKHNITIGISLDGPPETNDKFRIDHAGRGSSLVLEERLRLLSSERYQPIFAGFLCVVDVFSDPLAVYEYLASFSPPTIDFLLPYDNHDRRPPGKESLENTRYADWLLRIFEPWFAASSGVRIRLFSSLLRQFLGGSSMVESIGTAPIDLIVIETDGTIEAVDSMKATFEGAPVLGFDIRSHAFDDVLQHQAVLSRQQGADALCETCRTCAFVDFCGGGYIPHRYSSANGFDNPSVYCADLKVLIPHIYARARDEVNNVLSRALESAGEANGDVRSSASDSIRAAVGTERSRTGRG